MVENGNSRPGTTPIIEKRIDNGRVFSIRQLFTSVSSGTTRNIVLSNPPESDVNLLTVAPTFTASGKAYVQKYENATIDTSGTAITPRNKNLMSSRAATAEAETGGTYSGGTSRGREVIGSGAASGGVGGSIGSIDLSLRLDPGASVRYAIESQANSNDMSISVTFVEEPKTG